MSSLNKSINPIDAGLIGTLSILFIYLVWIILVFTNLAKPAMDYLFWIHFIKPIFEIESFNIYTSINLLLIVACIGFVVGYFIASVFNFLSSNCVDTE